jgi:lipid-binding SYLF domain-containing protein
VIFASFAGGKGIVVDHAFFTDDEIFMKMGSAGIGLGLGVKDFRAVFVFTDEDVM